MLAKMPGGIAGNCLSCPVANALEVPWVGTTCVRFQTADDAAKVAAVWAMDRSRMVSAMVDMPVVLVQFVAFVDGRL